MSFRQANMTNTLLILGLSQVVFVQVGKRFRQDEELGHELFDIGRVILAILPGRCQRMELAFGVVEHVSLHLDKYGRERFRSMSQLGMNAVVEYRVP
jgi:hypothetical protein